MPVELRRLHDIGAERTDPADTDILYVESAEHDNFFVMLSVLRAAILAIHEADTTNVHGIADTSVLATATSVASAITAHAGASDPHGDRAAAVAAIATHAAASDPHGDRAYALSLFAANDALLYKGAINCSANPNYPAADAGHAYKVSVAGKIGGASGPNVEVGDLLICVIDGSLAGTHGAVGANWDIIQVNLDGAVIGPAGATDGQLALFDGTSGRLIRAVTTIPESMVTGLVADLAALDARLDSLEGVDYATQAELDAHNADTTNVHGIADTSVLATATSVASAITAHAGASDPHGDRAAAASALATHEDDSTSVHGVADMTLLQTGTQVDSKITAHAGASDPHGDRAFTTSAVATHAGATDPHGDRAYADGLAAAMNAVVFKGVTDCSANPNYPAADAGHLYVVSVAGKIGGASGPNVEVGEELLCLVDSTLAGTQAGVGANWTILQKNIDGAVVGPTSATDNSLVRFDGTSGRLVKVSTGLAQAEVTGLVAALAALAPSDTAYDATSWDGVTGVAPSKNAVRDEFEVVIAAYNAKVSDTAYDATSWNGVTDVAPSKNAVRDEFETVIAAYTALVSDVAYDATSWDGVTGVAPSKNAVRDKIEALAAAKADLAGPTFTGDPKAPTPTLGDSDTSLATTAFVLLNALTTPTAVKTTTYAIAAGDLVHANTSGGGFTTTLPTTPANKTLCAVKLDVAGNSLVVACGGSAKFDSSTGATSKTMASAGQMFLVQYQTSGDLWIVLVDVLLSLVDGTYITIDTSTAGQAKPQLAPDIGVKTLTFLNGGTLVVDVDYMTVAALAAVTYAAGSSGVGATLTATGNGVMANVDGITPVNGDTLFVGHQAAGLQNGPYLVTNIGSAGTPFVLTRLTSVDTAAELANAVIVIAARGTMFGGHPLRLRGGTYVIGTTSVFGQSLVTLGDVIHGGRRDRLAIDEDFDTFDTFAGTTGQRLTGSKCTVVFTSTSAATQIEATDVVQGSIDLPTGTSTTGKYAAQAGFVGVAFDAFKEWNVYFRPKIPTLSDGTNTFGVKIGFQSSADGAPTDGCYFQARSGVTNWEAVMRAAGVETATVIDTGVAVTTGFVNMRIYAPGDGVVYFILGAAQVSAQSTNVPAALVWPVASILKSAGATSRSLRLDELGANVPNGRGSNFYAP